MMGDRLTPIQLHPSAPPDECYEIYSPPPPYNQLSVAVGDRGDTQRRVIPFAWNDNICPTPEDLSLASTTTPICSDDKIISPHKVPPALDTGNPLDLPRKFHDRHFLTAFGVYLLLMAVVAIFAVSTGSLSLLGECHPLSRSRSYYRSSSFSPTESYLGERASILPNYRNIRDVTTVSEFNRSGSDPGPVSLALRQYENDQSEPPTETLLFILVSMTFIALGFSVVMTILLKQFAGPIVWGIIFVCVFLVAIGCIMLWSAFLYMGNTTVVIMASGASIVLIILLLVIKVMKKRIQMVVRLFKEAGKAVQAIPLVVAQPVLTFIFLLIVTVICVVVGFMLENSVVIENGYDGPCVQRGFASASRWLNIFAYFWVTQFLVGCQHMVVAGAITQWFFTRDKSNLGSPLLKSWRNTIRFHLGSVAFASLVIAFVKLIRMLIRMITRGFSRMFPSCIGRLIVTCCDFIMRPVERFMIFLNQNAYVEIAIYGDGYIRSARRAFEVIAKNVPTIATINSVGDFVLFLAKVTVTGLTFVCGYFIAKDALDYDETLYHQTYTIVVLLIGTLFAFFISHCFLSVYEMAMDTIFVCFCEDCEINDGINRPYYMSVKLMESIYETKTRNYKLAVERSRRRNSFKAVKNDLRQSRLIVTISSVMSMNLP